MSNNPVDPGSGGAGDSGSLGGAGGGYISIRASGAVTINGIITANGSNGVSNAGGGSGGGVFIQCGSLLGNGTIQANGRNSSGGNGGGGSGGRIAIYARNGPFYTVGGNILFTLPIPSGGAGYAGGGVGTIYLDFKPRGTMFSSW
jgi:hypothetical protein